LGNSEKKSNRKIILTSLGVIGEYAYQLAHKTNNHANLPELEALGLCIGIKKLVVNDFLVIIQVYFLEEDIVQLFKVARKVTTDEMAVNGDGILSELAEEAVEIHHMISQDFKQAVKHD
jgi:hypothetical protein